MEFFIVPAGMAELKWFLPAPLDSETLALWLIARYGNAAFPDL
ncbi:MAG: hypothetical protein U0872_16690 [Planctomycetaceae bacterium]